MKLTNSEVNDMFTAAATHLTVDSVNDVSNPFLCVLNLRDTIANENLPMPPDCPMTSEGALHHITESLRDKLVFLSISYVPLSTSLVSNSATVNHDLFNIKTDTNNPHQLLATALA